MTDREQRRPWSKWKFLAVYWAVQAPLGFFGWAWLVADKSKWYSPWGDGGYRAWFAAVCGLLIVGQAVFLAPVRAPQVSSERPLSRLARCVLAGVAAGAMAACAGGAVWLVADGFGWRLGERAWMALRGVWLDTFWGWAAALSVIATLLLAVRTWRAPSARLSVAIAALGAGALAMGIPWVLYSLLATALQRRPSGALFTALVVGTLLVNWAVAGALLMRFLRRGPVEGRLGRIAAWLFMGTVVEAAAVIPVDIMVRRKTDCYCAEGTLWMLTVCWGLGAVMLGPAIWLIPLAKRRRRWYAGRCPACDYDMGGCLRAARCPECGAGWKAHES